MAEVADVEKLVAQWAPKLQAAFLEAVYGIRDRVVLAAVVRALEAGDVNAAVAAVGLEPAAVRPLDLALAQAFEGGGNATASSLPANPGGGGHRLLVLFDARNLRAEAWLRNHSSELVREIVADQRTVVQEHLRAGMAAGENPRTVALDLVGRLNPQTKKREGGVIGLTASQDAWARRYAGELATLSPKALERKLRDGRFDGAVRKAIKSGTPLSPKQIGTMVAAYRARALRYRAENIARTEAMAALHQSQYEAMAQAIEKGSVNEDYVTKEWSDSRDTRVRETHRAMNGQKVSFRESFTSPSGARLRYPGDPDAPAEERCQCRCNMRIRVDFLAQAARRGT